MIHRIGGGGLDNLRLKPREARSDLPGISVLEARTPPEAAEQIRAAFPQARGLMEAAKTVGSTTVDLIRGVGFDVIADPSRNLPNHHRIIHPDGAAGFHDANLARLSLIFDDTTGDSP